MNLSTIKAVITSKAARQILVVQKNSPKILFASGVVGVVATVVLASRATLNLEETLGETQDKMDQAKRLHAKGHASYSDMDYKQDVVTLYVRGATSIVKLYGPAFIVGALSIGALTGSHIILSKRNVGLTAAYATVEKAFAEYRGRTLAEVGEEKERDIRYGVETSTETTVDGKGKTKMVSKRHADMHGHSMYAKLFDSKSASWSPQPEYNLLFLRAQQNWANNRLHARGHVFLNEIYDNLGIERTTPGCIVGWVDGHGDSFIDFGIFDGQNMEAFQAFMSGDEGAILLDFNVDGQVHELI